MKGPPAPSFPDFLAATIPEADLDHAEASVAVIDPGGAILWVNRFWQRFANDNGGHPWRPGIASYFDGITPPLRDYYRSLFANVLATGEAFDHEYECSSPDQARHFHLRVLPIETRALVLEHSLVATHSHGAGGAESVLAIDYANAAGTILQCSNCRRLRRPGTLAWDWVPSLVAQAHPSVSHGICPSCVGFYWGSGRPKKAR